MVLHNESWGKKKCDKDTINYLLLINKLVLLKMSLRFCYNIAIAMYTWNMTHTISSKIFAYKLIKNKYVYKADIEVNDDTVQLLQS